MALKNFNFNVIVKDNFSRCGLIKTHRGNINTPAFMPVGTQATVKAVFINDIIKTGSEIILSNTYHLMIRPGVDRIISAGGLHEFMNCSLPILTDSGGFQVMSLSKLNKIDKENADSERVKTELSKLEVVPEDWGGETIFADVSAITGDGVDSLLEAISLQAELLELQAVIKGPASGYVIESSLDKGKGAVATVLIQNGTLQQGDIILCGKEYGRVRAMLDENGKKISEAGPSRAISVLGLSGSPDAGDEMIIVDDERKAKERLKKAL